MTMILVFLALVLLVSCEVKEKKQLDIPWYVKERINDDRESNYAFSDSLTKYKSINEREVSNLSNYYSYMANMVFVVKGPSNEVKKYLDKSFKSDEVSFCNDLILEVYEYLKPDGRPSRRHTMPFILDLDMDYYMLKLRKCDSILDLNHIGHKEELELRMSYLMLKDQWFRIPNRKADPEKQREFDQQNRMELDKLFQKFPFKNTDTDLRNNIFILLLHSTDCEWTEKWLITYIDLFRGYDKYVDHLNHFLWRSSCANIEVKKMIEEELIQFKRPVK